MVIDNNTFKKKNPYTLPFWRCQEYMQDQFCKGEKVDWDWVSSSFELPNWFIEQHINELNWIRLTRWQNFDEFTLRYFQKFIQWAQLNPSDYSLNFIREFGNKFRFKDFNLKNEKIIREFGDERYDRQINLIKKRQWLKEHHL